MAGLAMSAAVPAQPATSKGQRSVAGKPGTRPAEAASAVIPTFCF